MSGPAGPAIGTGVSNPNPIGGAAKVTADGAAVGRGSLQNFIGFGFNASNVEPLPEDFSVADDTVTVARTGNPTQEPVYSASATPLSETLTWTTPTP